MTSARRRRVCEYSVAVSCGRCRHAHRSCKVGLHVGPGRGGHVGNERAGGTGRAAAFALGPGAAVGAGGAACPERTASVAAAQRPRRSRRPRTGKTGRRMPTGAHRAHPFAKRSNAAPLAFRGGGRCSMPERVPGVTAQAGQVCRSPPWKPCCRLRRPGFRARDDVGEAEIGPAWHLQTRGGH